jgi:cysteine desulfurase
MTERAYFDWNATSPLRAEARAAAMAALDVTATASSVHAEGRAARSLVERARAEVGALVGAEPKSVVFTSGATETNMLALTPNLIVGGRPVACDRLFISAIEHSSALSGGRFPAERVERLPVTGAGVVDLDALRVAIASVERPLASIMHANNETGVIQPIAEIARIVHEAGGILHVDAVQTAGRIDCDIKALGADLMTLSSHKIGGPQGAGALVSRGDVQIAVPMIKGGGQERGQRAGTENVAAIAGFGAAASAAARQADAVRMAALRDRFEAKLKAATPGVTIFGEDAPRLPNTTLFSVPGLKAETAVISFDLNGVAVSSGSACSSGKVTLSHVLTAMGLEPALARGAVRVSLGWTTTEADIDLLLAAWIRVFSTLLKRDAQAA